MELFDSDNYRKYLKFRLSTYPKLGHGQARKLALHLSVSTTLVSQILAEQKHLTPDQAYLTSHFFGFSELESQYFMNLVQLERASNLEYRKKLEKNLKSVRDQSKKIEHRLVHQQILNEEQKAKFYSDWHFSAIRMLLSVGTYTKADDIARYFGLPTKMIVEALEFLEGVGLVVRSQGRLSIGPLSTHVGSDSSWVKMHHVNWRAKAIEHMSLPDPSKLHYSSPMTLSKNDVEKVRTTLIKMIAEIGHVVDGSAAEQLMCLNVDWFNVPHRGSLP